MGNKVDLKELFKSMQEEMFLKLTRTRKFIHHSGTKGDITENEWIEWLETYLPKRYEIDKAIVVDHEGNLSHQIDIVIYDKQYSPFVFYDNGVKYIPAESVYAIFEVKQVLNKEHIIYAGEKAESVRRLKRTSVPIVHAGGTYPARKPFNILAGIITTTSDWKNALGNSFENSIKSLNSYELLNIGCCLHGGAFLLDTEERAIIKSTQDESLIFFFVKLFIELQKLGTVPAMDIELYSRALKSF